MPEKGKLETLSLGYQPKLKVNITVSFIHYSTPAEVFQLSLSQAIVNQLVCLKDSFDLPYVESPLSRLKQCLQLPPSFPQLYHPSLQFFPLKFDKHALQ